MTKKVRKAVFPAAGLGTRFLPATKAMPKEMLTVVDKPVIQYVVEEAVAAGITELIFVTGRGKSAIENHFDKPYELVEMLKKKGKIKELESVTHIVPENVRFSYTRQGEPLGLGHAVWCARSLVGDEPFAVLLPDDIIHAPDGGVPLASMVRTYEETGTSVVMGEEVPLERTKNYGIFDIGGAEVGPPGTNARLPLKGLVEKPAPEEAPSRLGIVGRYVLDPRVFDFLEEKQIGAGGEIQLTDAIHRLCLEKGCFGLLLNGSRFDCGDKVGFQRANLYFALRDPYIGPRLEAELAHLMPQKNERKQA